MLLFQAPVEVFTPILSLFMWKQCIRIPFVGNKATVWRLKLQGATLPQCSWYHHQCLTALYSPCLPVQFFSFFLVVHIEQPVLQLLPTNILMEISSFSVLLKKSPMRPYPCIMTHSIRKQKRFCQSFKSRISYGCNEYPNGPFWAVLLLTSFQRQ